MKGLDVGFERMCKFGAGSMCAGNGKLRPAWSFWALLNDTPWYLFNLLWARAQAIMLSR